MWPPLPHAVAFAFEAGAVAFAVAAAAAAAAAEPTDACRTLALALPGNVAFPNTSIYNEQNIYWSDRQAELRPRCFVTPRNTLDVSTIVKTLTWLNASFAVKGGAHTAFEGASNIRDGVTINLARLNDITVSDDRQTVSVGPGNRWVDVSRILDPLGLAAVGGRVANVGVSGLILGGGISYFSGSHGWACDNVRNFEIVVASGRIVNASPTVNRDLFWALRGGGGSNFGIVTRFDLVAFPQADLWANTLILPGALNHTVISLFTEMSNKGLVEDPEAHSFLAMAYRPQPRQFLVVPSFFHATPPPMNATPPVFQPFQSLPGAISNITQVTNISAQSLALDEAYGFRHMWWDTTVAMTSATLLQDMIPLYEDYVLKLLSAANGSEVLPYLIFHPISQNVIEAMQKNGGNALGLKPSDGPLMLVQLATSWHKESLDFVIEQSSGALIHDIEKMAESKGLARGFVYMNYADKSQDVFQRYGHESYNRLKATAAKWDPERLFQKLWKGYFQVGGEVR